jgi:hypothetical protein
MTLFSIVKKSTSLLVLALFGAMTVRAQVVVPLEYGTRATCATSVINDPQVIREAWENTLALHPGIVEAVRQFSLQKGNADLSPGDQNLFWVYNIQKKVFDTLRAELKSVGTISYVWVALDEWSNGHVTNTEVDAIHRALEIATSPTSLDSSKGILSITRQVFGDPPNVSASFEKGKGDGKTHFLICDIQDGWAGSGSYVAGFFYSVDVDPFTSAVNTSNRRDMLYIDSYPGIFFSGQRRTSTALSTLSHEFQHLIHWNYDPGEATFFNEGLSEYSEFLCGLTLRSPLGYFGNTNLAVTVWNGTVEDYSRAALWTRFAAEQYGVSFLKKFVQNTARGTTAFSQSIVQAGYSGTFESTLRNFFIANWLGTKGPDPAYRYLTSLGGRPIVRSSYVDPNAQRTDTLNQQSVHYVSFSSARNFRVTFTLPASVTVRAVEDGTPVKVAELSDGVEFASASVATSVVFVVMNTSPGIPLTYSYMATGESLHFVMEESHDSGTPHAFSTESAPYLGFGNNSIARGMSVRFKPAIKGNLLRKARMLVMFNQEFSNGTALPTDDKDFMVHVWKDQNGRPGEDLIPPFLVTVDRAVFPVGSFVDIDFTPYENLLTNLEGFIYVGFIEDADDSVGTYVAVDNYTPDDYSYVYRGPNHKTAPNTWATMREISALNNNMLDGFNLMMRAVFEYSDSSAPPRMSVGYLQNPLFSEYVDVIAASADELRATSLTGTMTQTSGTTALRFAAIPNTVLAYIDTSQRLKATGAVSFKVRAAKKFGIYYTDTTVTLNGRLLRGGEPASLSSPSGEMVVQFENGAFSQPVFVTAFDGVSDPMVVFPETTGRKTFSLGPLGTELESPATIRISGAGIGQTKTIALFREGAWWALPSLVDERRGEIVASISRLGIYGLIDRNTAAGALSDVPREFALSQNYPNPFNPTTTISYHLPAEALAKAGLRAPSACPPFEPFNGRREVEGSAVSLVSLKVFDMLGREVAVLVDGVRGPGAYTVRWDASAFPSGVYLYRLRVTGASDRSTPLFELTKKMVLLR